MFSPNYWLIYYLIVNCKSLNDCVSKKNRLWLLYTLKNIFKIWQNHFRVTKITFNSHLYRNFNWFSYFWFRNVFKLNYKEFWNWNEAGCLNSNAIEGILTKSWLFYCEKIPKKVQCAICATNFRGNKGIHHSPFYSKDFEGSKVLWN